MTTNININKTLESNLPIDGSGIDGYIYYTEKGNMYVVNQSKNKVKISDIIVVSSLPSTNISVGKIYILSSQNYSLNYYDSSAWHLLGGSNQISIGTTAPIDTTKLWLDTSNINSPLLKYYNGTSWVSISGSSVDTSTLLDKATYKGSADGIVKKADTLTGLISTPSQIDSTVNNAISVDNTNRANGKLIGWNNGKNEYLDINVSGIVGSTGSIITASGSPVLIASGQEALFTHPSATDDKIMINVQEQIAGSSVSDTHVDFSDSSKYILQDSDKILVKNNKVELDIYTKLLIHADGINGANSFNDVNGRSYTRSGNAIISTTNSKFGGSSLYASNTTGGDYFYTTSNLDDFNFGTNDFTIDFWLFPTGYGQNGTYGGYITTGNGSSTSTSNWSIRFQDSTNKLCFSLNGSGFYPTSTTIALNQWYHFAFVRSGDKLYIFVNGTLNITYTGFSGVNVNGSGVGLYLFRSWSTGFSQFDGQGYMDEIRINKGRALWTSNFAVPTSPQSGIPYINLNTPLYLKTTGTSNYSISTINTFTSLTIPVTLPTNTSIKCLFSVDNFTTYLYYDGTTIQKFTGTLTSDWGSTNSSYTQLQTLFTNLSITTLTTMLSGLGIVPVSLDFALQLNTQILTSTPSISAITMMYTTKSHNEFGSIGSFNDPYTTYGVKRVSSSQLSVKNKSAVSKTVNVNVIISN